jgi:cathepsin L
MKTVVLLVVAVALALATTDPNRAAFKDFVQRYNKHYAPHEFSARFAVFRQNLDYINGYNALNTGVTLGVNEFADLTHEEFLKRYTGLNISLATAPATTENVVVPPRNYTCPAGSIAPNSSCDWRGSNAVTPIKNQGQCGSCWAFSTTGSVEGATALKSGKLVSLSEQNLVDCSRAEGNEGCNGGLMTQAFTYIIKNKGIDTEASYPYKAADGKCNFNAANVGATITSYQNIPRGNEAALTSAINTLGPISVAIDASHNSFQFYKSGVYYEKSCSPTQLDHGVLAVGIGNTNNQNY